MIAYLAYIACVLALAGIAYGLGYGSGQRHRARVNVSLITRDACERCVYLDRMLKVHNGDRMKAGYELENHYCRSCAVRNEIIKGG